MKLSFFRPDTDLKKILPFFESPVRAGFPSPADDFMEQKLDLNELIIKHPAASFFVRVEGDSMSEDRIHSGDILVVDRSLDAKKNSLVIAVINGEFTVKRFDPAGYLVPSNPAYKPIKITLEMEFEIWGVVTHSIHPCTA